MLLRIGSILLNIVYGVVLNLNLYTDRVAMTDGEARTWQRSPIDRLFLNDQSWLLYLQIALSAVSIITSILLLVGVKNQKSNFLKTVQIVSTAASTVMFIVIMIVTASTKVSSGSRALVGSSKQRISGFITRARAIATRCCCPPESSQG